MKQKFFNNLAVVISALRICLSALLCVSIFATGVMASQGCGMPCCAMVEPQIQMQNTSHMGMPYADGCCKASTQLPCGLTAAQIHELPDVLFTAGRQLQHDGLVTPFDGDSLVFTEADAGWLTSPLSIDQKFRSPPIYLHNLTILI